MPGNLLRKGLSTLQSLRAHWKPASISALWLNRVTFQTSSERLSGFILDLGGGPASFFAAFFPRQRQVILVDINYDEVHIAKRRYPLLSTIVADGKRLPFADCSIDLTVCNSVIEHVDTPGAISAEIRRVSRNYFLQTPHGGFIWETHSFIPIPLYSFLPWIWMRRLACKLFGAHFEYVQSVRYLSEVELRHLFPEATINYESLLGLKKSFYVYHVGMD